MFPLTKVSLHMISKNMQCTQLSLSQKDIRFQNLLFTWISTRFEGHWYPLEQLSTITVIYSQLYILQLTMQLTMTSQMFFALGAGNLLVIHSAFLQFILINILNLVACTVYSSEFLSQFRIIWNLSLILRFLN